AGRQSLHLRDGHALLLDPLDAGLAPFGEAGEGCLDRCARAQLLGEHARIFHRHAAALAHHRRARVRGITNQHDPSAVYFFHRHPLHRRADDLVVALERPEIFLNPRAEACEAAAQTLEASLDGIVKPRLDANSEGVGVTGTHGHEPEYAT